MENFTTIISNSGSKPLREEILVEHERMKISTVGTKH